MRLANIIVSITLLLFSGFYAVLIAKLPSRDLPNTLGAAFVPWVLAGLLAMLSLLMLFGAIPSKSDNSTVSLPKRELFGITGLLVLIALYVKLMGYLGFVPVSIVFLALLTWVAGSRKPVGIAFFSITTTIIVYLLFQKFFSVQLPAGSFF
jgi:hypothetical protein